jgi:hypothetical protein
MAPHGVILVSDVVEKRLFNVSSVGRGITGHISSSDRDSHIFLKYQKQKATCWYPFCFCWLHTQSAANPSLPCFRCFTSKVPGSFLQEIPLNTKELLHRLSKAVISNLADKRKIMSPTVFRSGGFRFFFFSREEKRMHVHAVSGKGEAKFWLTPRIALANNYHYSTKQLKVIESLIEAHHDELISAWKQHFDS